MPLAPQAAQVLLAGTAAFLISYLVTPIVRAVAVRGGWVARPVQDRWGRRTIARLGGVAMFTAFLVPALLVVSQAPMVRGLLGTVLLVFALGLWDDISRLPAYVKLMAQLLIGCLVVWSGIRVELAWSWLSIPLSVLWFVLVMNAFNLLDNMDGLAAGIGVVAAAFCAVHAAWSGSWVVAALAAALTGACAGFLRYNFPPAKIFMGDSGSHVLGLSLAALALLGNWHHSTQLLTVLAIPALVLAVPIFDTCFVTIQRLRHRVHPFVGGQDHVSHRLAILGLGVRRTVLFLYAISALFGVLSLVSVRLKAAAALTLWLFVLTGLVLLGRYLAKVKVYRLAPRPARLAAREATDLSSTYIETMLLHKRRLAEIVVDFILVSCMYVFAHLLRYEGTLSLGLQQMILKSLPLLLVVKFACFVAYGLYRGMWRYVGLADLITTFKAVTVGSVVSAVALLFLWRFEGFSRAVLIIDWMLTFLAIGGARVIERLLDEWITGVSAQGAPILVVGAGDVGARILRLLKDQGVSTARVVGFLDDDSETWGNRIQGVPVLGGRRHLPALIDTKAVSQVLVAIADPPAELLEYVRACCEPCGVPWKVVTATVSVA